LKVFSLFARSLLKPSWTFTPTGVIWRLLPASSGELIIESRDQTEKRTMFCALDGTTGLPLWRDLVMDEPWWIGIEDVAQGILLLHKFASPDMPQHQGIVALELQTGKLLWSNNDLTYWFTYGSSIFVHRMMFDKRVASELNLKTGELMREFGEEFESDLFAKREAGLHENQKGLQFPEMVDFDRIDPRIAGIMKKALPLDKIKGPIEYVSRGDLVLMNYHIPVRTAHEDGIMLNNHFNIIDSRINKLQYGEIITHNSRTAVPDSFFVRNGMVYFIQEQKTLTAITLPES